MHAVKPYYENGYKNRVFDRFSKAINTIFSNRTKGNYKIFPFLPMVLFVFYPLFFDIILWRGMSEIQQLLPFLLALLPLYLIVLIYVLWWSYCEENFKGRLVFGLFKKCRQKEKFELEFEYEIYKRKFKEERFIDIFAIIGLFPFSFIGVGIIIGISTLTMSISKNETISFYIATLPIALGLSYAILVALKKERRHQT